MLRRQLWERHAVLPQPKHLSTGEALAAGPSLDMAWWHLPQKASETRSLSVLMR